LRGRARPLGLSVLGTALRRGEATLPGPRTLSMIRSLGVSILLIGR